ncbi:MAG: hypothetical protein CSB23_04055 [Deltaproteobacteria bacterium]|nr:MAG: hypothetical protein CSB23_04055 [Deltaproteobacteria bacterium]
MLRNLKVQIAIALFVLLILGMCSITFVALVLWQKESLLRQTSQIQRSLKNAGRQLETSWDALPPGESFEVVERFFVEESLSCLYLLRDGRVGEAKISCGQPEKMKTLLFQTAGSGETVFQIARPQGLILRKPRFFTASLPLKKQGRIVGSIVVAGPLDTVFSHVFDGKGTLPVYLLVTALLFTTVGFFRMLKIVVRPLEKVVQIADNYRDSSDPASFINPQTGEFAQIAYRLKQMLKRIDTDNRQLRLTVEALQQSNDELKQARNEIVQAEKLASVGRMSAGLAHEVGNPLSIVKGYLELLEQQLAEQDDSVQYVSRAASEVERIEKIIRQLLDCARRPSIELVAVDLGVILEDLVGLFCQKGDNKEIGFQLDRPDVLPSVAADADSLRQVFLNCLLNSVDAVLEGNPEEGKIRVQILEKCTTNGERSLLVIIEDNGPGVDPEALNNLFDPFYTTKQPGKGTGLGLAVSYTLVKQFAGSISVRNREQGGFAVHIQIPVFVE